MTSTLLWVIGGLLLLPVVIWAFSQESEPAPAFEYPMPPPASGQHTIIAWGRVDEGYFALIRTPLWEYPFNAVLLTHVVFDDAGSISRARYCRASTIETGKIDVGKRSGKPVTITIGTGAATAQFSEEPTTIWTH